MGEVIFYAYSNFPLNLSDDDKLATLAAATGIEILHLLILLPFAAEIVPAKQTQMQKQTQTHSPFAHPHIRSSHLFEKHIKTHKTLPTIMVSSNSPQKCAHCPTTTNLKRCEKCQKEFYCTRSY
jgi:hypothetical protein